MKKTTLVIVPRERFTLAARSLRSVIEHLQGTEAVVYVDAGSPKKIADELRSICQAHDFTYIRRESYLSPNQARNVGLSHASTPYVVFMDNDIIVSPGWLAALESCADETGAEIVAPLTCQKEPLHSEVHQAGGQIFDNFEAFLSGLKDETHLTDLHLLQGKPAREAGSDRRPVECCEFHCVLVRRDVFDRLGPLDEQLLSTKEHIDFSLAVWTTGGQVMLEPKSIVTYLFPDRSNPLQPGDWPYFLLRWSPEWQQQSLDHFKAKWDLVKDPYFEKRRNILVCPRKSGPLFELVPASDMELRHGQEINA